MASIAPTPTVNISPNMPGLDFNTPLPSPAPTPTAPVGVKAKSPVTNVTAPSNKLPAPQVAPKDLSSTYGRTKDGTIYNKNSQTKFGKPEDFFKDAGVSDFNNLKFDINYTPSGKETVYGQATQSFGLGDGKQYDVSGKPIIAPAPVALPAPSSQTPITQTPLYSPPNQGTTGVSQGGIIGNLINMANNETEEVRQTRADAKALREDYGQQNADIMSRPQGLTQQTGQQGILASLFATKQSAAEQALQSALASQQQRIGAQGNAGQLNAPITGVPYGTQTIQPSQANGGLTSGAQSLDALVGQRQVPGQKQVEFFDKNTGQAFGTPQALADFVNQQLGSNQANATNVFNVLKQQGQGNNQNGGALNPINNVTSIAQQVISGQISPSQAYTMGGNVANWQGLLNQEMQRINPSFSQSDAQARFDANQSTQSSQAQQKATWQSAYQQGKNLQSQFNDLLKTFSLNPSDINVANQALQAIAANTSDWRYSALNNYVNEIANTYAQILTPAGGSVTDLVRSTASSMLDSAMSGAGIKAVMDALDQQAQAKIAGLSTPSTVGGSSSNSSGSSGAGGTEGQTAAGGGLVYKNGKWQKA